MTDFGADAPFAQAMDKLVEHYGVLLSETTVARITQKHARCLYEAQKPDTDWPEQTVSEVVIAEMDGGMVPIVQAGESQPDKRKGKVLSWKEAKLCLAHAQGSRTLSYGGVVQGDVVAAGEQLFACAVAAGFGRHSRVHAVGDGAPWIAAQVEEQFGAKGSYLIDFYPVCEYLNAAAHAIVSQSEVENWMNEQKERLKTQRVHAVIDVLSLNIEAPSTQDTDAPVRRCHRYLSQRLSQLDYQHALDHELPIGSGEIESAHRYIVQQRLKRSGSWWRIDHAEHLLALRLNRANKRWREYWLHDKKAA
jgi:hypothetical protein